MNKSQQDFCAAVERALKGLTGASVGNAGLALEYHEWSERDRAHVELRDARTQNTVIEFRDDEVHEAIRDGFLSRNCSTYEYEDDLRELAEERDLLPFHCPQCSEPQQHGGEIFEEPSFSWQPCDCCGSHLGGDREPAHAFDERGELYHFDICVDCILYLANGELPESWK